MLARNRKVTLLKRLKKEDFKNKPMPGTLEYDYSKGPQNFFENDKTFNLTFTQHEMDILNDIPKSRSICGNLNNFINYRNKFDNKK